MFKHIILSFLAVIFSYSIQAQVEANYSDAKAPNWALEMYKSDADVGLVIDMYEAYYKDRDFVKNQHTQYYKRWIRSLTRKVEHSAKNNRKSTATSRMADWTCIGPWDWDHDAAARSYAPGSAHVYTVEQSISNPDVLYAGSATAGLWKTTDRGDNWSPLTDDMDVNQVYAIEIDHTDEDVVYAVLLSTIMKSTDGGTTWQNTGNVTFQNTSLSVRDIVMDPNDNQVILAACQQGLYRTSNAGNSWTLIDGGYFLEVEFHPTNSDTIYAVSRDSDGDSSDDHSHFHRSTNNGVSFTEVGTGWPADGDHQRRAEISVSADAPDYVYAHVTGSGNGGSGLYGIYISDDNGDNWTFECCGPQPAGAPDLSVGNYNIMAWAKDGSDDGGQYYYDVAFGVSPFNADSIWAGGVNMWVSGDGGVSFECKAKWSEPHLPEYVHADNHDFHYYEHTGEIWISGDGGIFLSTDNGQSFERKVFGIAGTDFWGFDTGWWEGDIMLGGAYHNGTHLKENDVYLNDWLCTDGGDGNYGRVHPARAKNVHSWFNIKDLKSDRTVAPSTRNNPHEANASYITGEDSDILFHPTYYDTWWVGSVNSVYKTSDNGFTFEELHNFGNKVTSMDISMSDPDVIYATTWPGWWSTKQMFRSDDGGYTWTEITPSTALLINQTWMPYDIVVDPLNPMRVTALRTSMYNEDPIGPRLIESTDGGATWNDIGGNTLAGQSGTTLKPHQGTEGGLFVGTRKKVFYKDDNMADFEDISSDLPVSIFTETLIPYYREQKLRTATNRSVWERPFTQNNTRVIARPTVQKDSVSCTNDTLYFQDLSVVSEQGVSWQWTFEGGTPATATVRDPKVIYECPGVFDVTLTVTDDFGTETVTISDMVTVLYDCNTLSQPYKALKTLGTGDYVNIDNDDWTNIDEMTITAWVKPSGIQDAYSGIVFGDGDSAGLNFRSNDNTLGYHWPGGSWSWNSGLKAPADEWSYVALVVTPNDVTIYLNGESSIHSTSINPADINSFKIGSYKGWGSRNYRGEIEEVAIWDRALSESEIREKRHITKDPSNETNMLAYYNFNREDNIAVDLANGNNGSLSGNSEMIDSDAPIGDGTADLVAINGLGTYPFPNTMTEVIYSSGDYPEGTLVVSHIVNTPGVTPSGNSLLRGYYIINDYTRNPELPLPQQIHFKDAGTISNFMATSSVATFHTRGANKSADSWTDIGINSYDMVSGIFGEVNITDASPMTDFGQYYVTRGDFTAARANVTMATDPSEVLEIEGGTSAELALINPYQGLTLPHFSSTQIGNLATPVAGSLLFDKDMKVITYYDGTGWNKIISKLATDEQAGTGVSVGNNITLHATSGSSASILDLKESGGVLLLPSFTNEEIADISTPVNRMIIYNETDRTVQAFNNSYWQSLLSESITYGGSGVEVLDVDGTAIGQTNIEASAALQISANNSKTLALTVGDHREILNPTAGTLTYSTVSNRLMLYNGEFWESVYLD